MKPTPLPEGVWPVMLTPFQADRSIDWRGLDQLIEWYLEAGVKGLFAVCLSSEFYDLTPDERLALAAHVVKRVDGRVPVVASGTFGGPIAQQATFVRRMFNTGVQAVVLLACQMASEEESDACWQARVEELMECTGDIPLGLYECPVPYKRLVALEQMRWAAGTGRFLFHKDTSCRIGEIRAKIEAARGTPLRFYNAHAGTLLESLQAGGDGYTSIAANFYPSLFVWLCEHWRVQPEKAERLQHFLTVADMAVRHKYPASAKQFLRRCGLAIHPYCRRGDEEFVEFDGRVLDSLAVMAKAFEAELGIQR